MVVPHPYEVERCDVYRDLAEEVTVVCSSSEALRVGKHLVDVLSGRLRRISRTVESVIKPWTSCDDCGVDEGSPGECMQVVRQRKS